MEPSINHVGMLSMFTHPVFQVVDGLIVAVNRQAADLQIKENTPVFDILESAKDEYRDFTGGTMSLSVKAGDVRFVAAVVKCDQSDIFHILTGSENNELQALALAAQHLREPLCNVIALTDTMLTLDDNPNPKNRLYSAQLNQNLHKLMRTIGNMSDTGVCANRTSGMQIQNITALINDALLHTKDLLGQNHQLLVKPCNDNINGLADDTLLERAVYNMISNAIRYSPEGSTVTASVQHSKAKVILTVENECPNFSPEQMGTLFFRYRRTPSVTEGNTGLGLGIPLIQAVAAAHRGSLLFTLPEPGKVRFCLTIPVRTGSGTNLRSPILRPDYAGGYDHRLIELADILPSERYE